MIQQIVAIYDKAAEAFLTPVFVKSNGAAIRSFADAVKDPSTDFGKHPADYAMFNLGQYDDSMGEFIPNPNGNVRLVDASSLVEQSF